MPINVPNKLPAKGILEKENIFVIGKKRALHQDIRPLKIALVNLMPTKIETERQLLRLLSNTPLQIEIEFINMDSYKSKNTPQAHFDRFYKQFKDIKDKRFDGLIITGAPVEKMDFEEVAYWEELKEIMAWAQNNVTSTLFLCWGAQAGLYFHHKIKKYPLKKKIFGVFSHAVLNRHVPLVRGFDEGFLVPHSRHTEVKISDIKRAKDLEILAVSKDAGVHIIASKNGRQVFVMGHHEYEYDTLQKEYERDLKKNLPIKMPENYFPGNNPARTPSVSWRSHGFLLYFNWLNYYVYQSTPYNWIKKKAA